MTTAPWSRIAPALAGLGLLYLATQFARNALGIISDDIEADLALRATETALLAGTMFLAYGLGQIPAAALLTRLGARVVLPAAGALLAASLWDFAEARTFTGLLAARMVMGLAAAPVLAGAFASFASFGEARFATLAGLQTAFGRAGVIVATTPLALLVSAIGWRAALSWAAAATALAAIAASAALFTLPPRPKPEAATTAAPMRELLASPAFRTAALFQGASTAVSSTILGLWGGPWLDDVYDMGVREQGSVLLALAIAAFVSAPCWGYVARRRYGQRLVTVSAVLSALLLAVPAVVHLPRDLIVPWLVLLGLATGFYPAILEQLRKGLPPGAIVNLSTLLTAGTMLVVFLVQFATGLLADQFPGHPGYHAEAAYRAIFALMAGLLALTTLLHGGVNRSSRQRHALPPQRASTPAATR